MEVCLWTFCIAPSGVQSALHSEETGNSPENCQGVPGR